MKISREARFLKALLMWNNYYSAVDKVNLIYGLEEKDIDSEKDALENDIWYKEKTDKMLYEGLLVAMGSVDFAEGFERLVDSVKEKYPDLFAPKEDR